MKKVNVLGIEYEIIQLSPKSVIDVYGRTPLYDDVKQLIGEDGRYFAGLCDTTRCKIYINADLPYEKRVKALIHEFMEAVDNESSNDLEHVKIQSITNALFLSGLFDVKELLKVEPEDIEISISGSSA